MDSHLNGLASNRFGKAICAALAVVLVSACTTAPTKVADQTEKNNSRYELVHDRGPSRPVDVEHVVEPVPRVELRTRAGNKSPYTVLGKTYRVMASPEGYRERGVASWYGEKFHGKKTSNGEIYDMYGMTAAHKTLPIPSYVRVTNVANKKSVIVRVNDRGPFHGKRIIDLSYSAAKKVGLQAQGTGEVLVEYIDPHTYAGGGTPQRPGAAGDGRRYAIPDNTYLQVGAYGEKDTALAMGAKLRSHTRYPVLVLNPKEGTRKLYRVRIGPVKSTVDLMHLKRRLKNNAFPDPYVVYP